MKSVYTRYSLQNHLLVITEHVRVPTAFKPGFNRESVKKFSASSRHRMSRYLRCSSAVYRNMVTLTYPEGYPKDGRVFKEHLRRFIQELKRDSERQGITTDSAGDWSCFWFMEFQRRGAAHFHLFTTHDYPHLWVASKWYRIVNSEDERHLRAGTRIERIRAGRRGVVSYANKYAAKSEQKVIPKWVENAGRFWGVSGNRQSVAADTLIDPMKTLAPTVKRKVRKLHLLIKNALKDRQIKYSKHPGSRIMYLKNDELVAKIANALRMIELVGAASQEVRYVSFPHHEIEDS